MRQFIKDPSSFSKRRIDNLCAFDKLDDDFIRKYSGILNWSILSSTQELSKNILQEFSQNINWLYYFQFHEATEDFIREFKDEIKWNDLCVSCSALSENFLREFTDRIEWLTYSRWKKASPKFMEEIKDNKSFKFSLSLFHQKYPEEFIRKHIDSFTKDYLDTNYVWTVIPQTQTLSEAFIHEHKDEIRWDEVCRYQKLSIPFMDEHAKYLNWEIVVYNQTLSEDFIEKYWEKMNRCDIRNVIINQSVSQDFMRKHADDIIWINDINFYWDGGKVTFSKGVNKNLTKKFVIEMLKRESEREGIGNFTKMKIKEKIQHLRGRGYERYI